MQSRCNTLSSISAIANALLPVLGSGGTATSLVKGNASGVTTQLGNNTGFTNFVQPSGTQGNTPQAYLTVLFFDERFNFISAADGGAYSLQIAGTTGANGATLTQVPVKAPKNGYVYVYLSNCSDQNVYFDNFKVQVQQGNLIEENHYYAYGLKIASISSVKLGDGAEGGLQNNYQYQGSYSELDADIGWNDFELRNYNAQTGRWVQPDPYQQYPSPYTGMGNDPVNNVDPDGGGVLGLTPGLFTAVTTLSGAIIGGDISAASGGSFWKGAAIGAAVGFAAGYIPSLVGGGVSISLSHAMSIFSMSVKVVGAAKDIYTDYSTNKSIKTSLNEIVQQQVSSSKEIKSKETSYSGGVKSIDKNPKGFWERYLTAIKNTLTVTSMTMNWLVGTAPYSKAFNNDRMADALRNSDGVVEARKKFYQTGEAEGDYNFEKGGKGPIDAGFNNN